MGYAMVIDLNKCLGCQTCTVACKRLWTSEPGQEAIWWNHVETQPGHGWPKGWLDGAPRAGVPGHLPSLAETGGRWEFELERVQLGNFVPAHRLEPGVAETGGTPVYGPNWEEDQGTGEFPNVFFYYLPRLCNHCERPACRDACPRGAIRKRDDGVVLIEEARCRGYRFCIEACPYKKIYFNPTLGIAQKCIFCFPRVEEGRPPACVGQCPGRARFFGRLEDPASPVHRLVREFRVALPLLAERGTGPNVYYVPPLAPASFAADGRLAETPRIPRAHLRELFGPEVDGALERLEVERHKKAAGEPSALMDLLILYRFEDAWKLA